MKDLTCYDFKEQINAHVSSKSILEWLVCKELFLRYFSKEEIEQAIKDLGIVINNYDDNSLVTKNNHYNLCDYEVMSSFLHEPHCFYNDWELICKHNTIDYDNKTKQQRTKYYAVYRKPNQFQELLASLILQKLLDNKYQWYKEFKFQSYISNADNIELFEIYLLVPESEHAVYVPLKALLEKNPELIKTRTLDYAKNYYRTWKPENYQEIEKLFDTVHVQSFLGYVQYH
jgi:hypothetical protein